MSYKDRYMLANCQFILNIADVRETGDNLVNPDKTVEWQKVMLARIFCSSAAKSSDHSHGSSNSTTTIKEGLEHAAAGSELLPDCPICFHPPVAAKITRCGHVYCWPCMLHYLALIEDDKREWQKCPVCSEPVYLRDLKSCMPMLTSANRVERGTRSALKMVMMHRDANSAVALPHHYADLNACNGGTNNNRLIELLRYGSIPNQNFAKILYMDNKQIQNEIYEWERDQLMIALHEEDQMTSTESMFIQQALQILDMQLDLLLSGANLYAPEEQKLPPRIRSLSHPARSTTTSLDNRDAYARFYQSDDGQLIYLCNLSHRMLMHEYGNDVLNMPDCIQGHVIDVEHITVSDETRRRYKFLRHVPRMAEVLLVELDMPESVISEHTRAAFQREVNNRAAARAQRHLREMRLKEKAEKSLFPLWYQIKERHSLRIDRQRNGTSTEIYDRDLRPEDFICEGGLPSTSPPGVGEQLLLHSASMPLSSEVAGTSSAAATSSGIAATSSFAKAVKGQKPRVERMASEAAPTPRRLVNINANDESEFPSLGGGSFSPPTTAGFSNSAAALVVNSGRLPSSMSTTPAAPATPQWTKKTRTTSTKSNEKVEFEVNQELTAEEHVDFVTATAPPIVVSDVAARSLSVGFDAESDFPSLGLAAPVGAPPNRNVSSSSRRSTKSKMQPKAEQRKLIEATNNVVG